MKLSELIKFHDNFSKLQYIREHRKNIIPFVGAGISIDCGLYSWGDMLDIIAKDFLSKDEIEHFHKENNFFNYADKIVEASGNVHLVMKRISNLLQNTETKPSISTHILTSSFSDLIVTTNYDTILERAASQNVASKPLKPLLPCLKGQIDDAIQTNERCLLKLHGSIEETSSFILTTPQYNKYYGKPNTKTQKPLPSYLEKLFSGKKVLFVGCSLESDRTLDILQKCVKRYKRITHFAIVPWIEDEAEQIKRTRQLTHLGIEPIYFPAGEYKSIESLLCYLSQENLFISLVRKVLSNLEIEEFIFESLIGILQKSYHEVTLTFPELLDEIFSVSKSNLYLNLCTEVKKIDSNDTLYSVIIKLFNIFVDLGTFKNKENIKNSFNNVLSKYCLCEDSIDALLEKRWSISQTLNDLNFEMQWVQKLSEDEVDNYANDLLEKLQYKNGMNFADIVSTYNQAKHIEMTVGSKISYSIHIRLLNSIGAFSYFVKDSQNGVKYLEKAIDLINKDNSAVNDKNNMLFLAKCHYNLALNYAAIGKYSDAIQSISKDIHLKKQYDENPQLYARSCDLYATILKEIDPIKAGYVYLLSVQTKSQYVFCENRTEPNNEMLASWATSLFNIGLLARDLGLLNTAYNYIVFANRLRFKTVNKCSKDYCSSLNVQAEIGLYLSMVNEAKNIVEIVESKKNLPEGFSKIMGHTWYVCAYYYYQNNDYPTAFKYICKSIDRLLNDDVHDEMQIIKSKILQSILIYELKEHGIAGNYESSIKLLKEIIQDIHSYYGEQSYFLTLPYRYIIKYTANEAEKSYYTQQYDLIYNKYNKDIDELNAKLKAYIHKFN